MKRVLITGGTGTFGKKIIESLLSDHNLEKIIVYSRDELKQFEMQQLWPDDGNIPIRYFLGDVRDYPRLKMAMNGIDTVLHAAALKQVPAAEYNPFEAVKTNIIGAQNVIDAAISQGVKKVVALSTDKAAAPINLYGATKLASDKLFIAANNYTGNHDIKLSVVRYGNVFGSRGSVVPYFLKQKEKGVLPITDSRMTRFSITKEEGVDFVLKCIKIMNGGELYVPKIPSYRILDLVKAISKNIETKVIGLRPGEKLHEEMITKSDSMNTLEFNEYFVILPDLVRLQEKQSQKTKKLLIGSQCPDGFSYNSETNPKFLSINELRELIQDYKS